MVYLCPKVEWSGYQMPFNNQTILSGFWIAKTRWPQINFASLDCFIRKENISLNIKRSRLAGPFENRTKMSGFWMAKTRWLPLDYLTVRYSDYHCVSFLFLLCNLVMLNCLSKQVTHRIPNCPIFEWSFFGHFLCPVFEW